MLSLLTKIFHFCARSVALLRCWWVVIENKSTSRSSPQEEGNSPRSITVSFSILFLYLSVKNKFVFSRVHYVDGVVVRGGGCTGQPGTEQNSDSGVRIKRHTRMSFVSMKEDGYLADTANRKEKVRPIGRWRGSLAVQVELILESSILDTILI